MDQLTVGNKVSGPVGWTEYVKQLWTWGTSHPATAVVKGKDAGPACGAGEGDSGKPTFTEEIN